MNKFKINDFLTLKLEEEKTNIYVNGVLFNQCKYLMLNIPIEETEKFDEIESIDEAADILGWTYDGQEGVEYEIDPETEFWGHCSNLQVWYENDYNTRLLHSNLSFPLLKELAEVGDPVAKYVFKEEIVKRFESGYPTVIVYIVKTQLLDCLDREELSQLIDQSFSVILTAKLPDEDKFYVFSALLKAAKKTGWKKDYFSTFFEIIDKLPRYYQYGAFYNLINTIKDFGDFINQHYDHIKTFFIALKESIEKVNLRKRSAAFSYLIKVAKITGFIKEHAEAFLEPIYVIYPSNHAFNNLLKLTKETGLKEEHFPEFLEILDKSPNKYHIFFHLTKIIKGSKFEDEYNSRIEAIFSSLIEAIEKLTYDNLYYAFFWLLNVAKTIGLVNVYFPILFKSIDKFSNEDKIHVFITLHKVADDTGWTEEYFPVFLKFINNIPDVNKYNAISSLISQSEETGWVEEYFPVFLETVERFTDRHKFRAFNALITSISSELLNKFFPQIETLFLALLKSESKVRYRQYNVFFELLNAIKKTRLLDKFNSQIEAQFLALLNNMDKIPGLPKIETFSKLLKVSEITGLTKKHILLFLETIDKLHGIDKYSVFKTLIIAIRETELMNGYYSRIETKFLALLNSIDRLPNYVQYRALFDLIISFSKSPKSWNKYYLQIKNQFFILLNNVDQLPSHLKNVTYSILIRAAKNTDLENEPAFKQWVEKNPNFKRRII